MKVFFKRLLAAAFLLVSSLSRADGTNTLFGFTAFPYDLSLEAVEQTYDTVLEHSSLFPLHMDDCVPWYELLAGSPIPAWLQEDWTDIRRRVAGSRPLYVAVTPTGTDRRTIAPACGKHEDEKRDPPEELRRIAFDSTLFQRVYLAYAELVIEFFKPRFINIGIEMSELSLSYPKEWPAFARLYRSTFNVLKQNHPQIQIGIELVLQSIMTPRVGKQVRPVIDLSDFICISFYPYASAAGVAQGAVALPRGRAQWREPLDWLREYTDKPLAVCETGYASRPFTLHIGNGIPFEGNPAAQETFLKDLVKITNRDNYLFVIWFAAIDYDRLLEKIPDAPEWFGIWKSIGLFDPWLKPKPAWRHWPLAKTSAREPPGGHSQSIGYKNKPKDNIVFSLGNSANSTSFTCVGSQQIKPSAKTMQAMSWSITYSDDWTYCAANIVGAELSKAKTLNFRARAKRAAPLFIRFDLANGQSWYYIITLEKYWQHYAILLKDFIHTEGSNKQLPKAKVISIAIADGAGADGEKRPQRYLFTPFEFHAQ